MVQMYSLLITYPWQYYCVYWCRIAVVVRSAMYIIIYPHKRYNFLLQVSIYKSDITMEIVMYRLYIVTIFLSNSLACKIHT